MAAEALKHMPKMNDVISGIAGAIEGMEIAKTDEETKEIPVHCNLAANYGKLDKGVIQEMDDFLKVTISGTLRAIEKHNLTKYATWGEVRSIFEQNVLIELVPGSEIDNITAYTKNGTGVFKTDGSPDDEIVKEVYQWYVNELVTDADVRQDSVIDINDLGKIVASSGAQCDSFVHFFHNHEVHRRNVVEIGILRFPDIENPFFKVYRIQLTAWSDCTRTLMVQEDRNGIEGQFNCAKYKPRESVLKEMRHSIIDKAAKEAEDLFS